MTDRSKYVMEYVKEQYMANYGVDLGWHIDFVLERLIEGLDLWEKEQSSKNETRY